MHPSAKRSYLRFYCSRQYSIPPIHGAQPYSKQPFYATTAASGPGSNYGVGVAAGTGHRDVMSRGDGGMGYGMSGFGGLPAVKPKKGTSQTISFPKIQAGYGMGGGGLMRSNVSPGPGPGMGGLSG